MVAWRKHGTKTRKGNGIGPGKTQGHNLKVHEAAVNETRSDADVGKAAPTSGSPREGKKKLSPTRSPMGLQLSKVVQNIIKGSLLLDLSLAGLGPKAKAHIDSSTK